MRVTNDDELPRYAVRIAPVAAAQAAAEYDWLKANHGQDRAEHWREELKREELKREELKAAWASLATLPLRCAAAPEDAAFQEFQPGPPLRTFRYKQGRRSDAWRLLFTAHEATADDPAFVQVHRLLHSAQAPLLEWPQEQD